MRRRAFIRLLAGAVASTTVPLRAQQVSKTYRVGFLWEAPTVFPDAQEAFRQELRNQGYIEGQSIIIEYRWAEGKPELMRKMAEELVRFKVDAIVAPSSIYTGAAIQATSTIPIIFMSHAAPLETGHVASLARPGGNVTGLSLMQTETGAKTLELFKEAAPSLRRVAVLMDPATPSHIPGLNAVEAAGSGLGLQIQPVTARAASDYDAAFTAMARDRADGVLVLSTPLFIASAKRLAELALMHKLPSLFGPKHHVEAGGLMSYSPDRKDLWRRGAIYLGTGQQISGRAGQAWLGVSCVSADIWPSVAKIATGIYSLPECPLSISAWIVHCLGGLTPAGSLPEICRSPPRCRHQWRGLSQTQPRPTPLPTRASALPHALNDVWQGQPRALSIWTV
jgi:putative tryptophan/tyrosine transport system substrate-binding protein